MGSGAGIQENKANEDEDKDLAFAILKMCFYSFWGAGERNINDETH